MMATDEHMEEAPEETTHFSPLASTKEHQNLPWVEKYRPESLDDLISHKDIISTIQRFIDENKLPHMLFYGPPGTGKTSTILACARKLYGPKYQSMILELNASDDRGIDVVREKIKDFASTRKIFSAGFKLIILDEADAMTNVAQAALRRVIEKYTRNTRFVLICNYVSKIIPALQSRCTRFRFSPLSREQMDSRIQHVIDSERISVTEDGMRALTLLAKGDMRKALNILQCTSMAYDEVNETNVYTCTGNPLPKDIEKMVEWMLNDSFETAYKNVSELKTLKGLALQDILTDIHAFAARIDFPAQVRIHILREMAEIEHRVAHGTSEKAQLGALIGVFQLARNMVSPPAGK
eukprot:Colp12_sorted_trinity150504_noHs@510